MVLFINPHWHELWKQEKCSVLVPPRGIFYKTQWAWQSVELTRLMSIFTSKKVWKLHTPIRKSGILNLMEKPPFVYLYIYLNSKTWVPTLSGKVLAKVWGLLIYFSSMPIMSLFKWLGSLTNILFFTFVTGYLKWKEHFKVLSVKANQGKKVVENYIWFPAVHENSLVVLKFEMPTPQLFLFWLKCLQDFFQ